MSYIIAQKKRPPDEYIELGAEDYLSLCSR